MSLNLLGQITELTKDFFLIDRQFVHPNSYSIVNGIRYRWRGWDARKFSNTLGTIGSIFGGMLNDDRMDLWCVDDRRHSISCQVIGDYLPFLNDEVLCECITQTHNYTSFNLTLESKWVERLTDIIGGDHIQYPNLACLGVHFNFCSLGSK